MHLSKSVMFLLGATFGGVCGFVVASERNKRIRQSQIDDIRRAYRSKLGEQWSEEEKAAKEASDRRIREEKTERAKNIHEMNTIIRHTAYSSLAKSNVMPENLVEKNHDAEALKQQSEVFPVTMDESEDSGEEDRSDDDSMDADGDADTPWVEDGDSSDRPGPYLIGPEIFEHADEYSKETLFYYETDGMLIDDNDDVIDAIDRLVGYDALDHFGDYEPEACYVRNERLGVDYMIILRHCAWEPYVPGAD